MSDVPTEAYLGDGLYFKYDGFAVWLRAPREHGDHEVALEPEVLMHFIGEAMRIPRCRAIIRQMVMDIDHAEQESRFETDAGASEGVNR